MIDRSALAALELDLVLEKLEALAATPLGIARVRAAAPLASLEEALAEAGKVGEYAGLLATGRDVSLGAVGDVGPVLGALAKDGLVLTGEELAEVRKLVLAVGEAARFLLASREAVRLRALVVELPGLRAMEPVLARTVDDEGNVLDSASPALADVRSRRRTAAERLDRSITRFFETHSEITERIATIREERSVIAIRSDQNPSRYGLVHGRSSTGATFYVEPFELVPLNNAQVELREEERLEIERVLRAVTARLAEHRGELDAAAALVAELDFVRARARLRIRLGGGPVEGSLDGSFELVEARHPLLVLATPSAAGGGGGDESSLSRVVPLDIRLAAGETVVVTGPNTGGKTVALKTIGLQALLFACGLPVSARSARLPLLGSLHVDIGDPQDIAQSLSTFSGHVRRVGRMLESLTLPALVLLDEVGSGTDPREGAALAIAIAERLRLAGATSVLTSHHEPLKRYALGTPGVRSAAVEFDLATLRPTFRLLLDRTGSSNALVIAEKLGVPADVIAHARRLVAGEETEVERILARLEESSRATEEARKELELERRRIAAEEERLQSSAADVAAREAALRAKQGGVRAKLRAEFEARLRLAIDELREEGRKAVASLEEGTRRRVENQLATGLHAVGGRLLREEEETTREPEEAVAAERVLDGTPRPGDRVRVPALGVVGELVAIEGKMAVVSAHGKTLRAEAASLERLGRSSSAGAPGPPRTGKSSRPTPTPVAAPAITVAPKDTSPTEMNLLGTTVDDALPLVDKLLDDAVRAGLPEVRIIHGHGTGRLRAGIREHLRGHPQVRSLASASQDGVTIVVLAD